jgi:penicillin G amidase
LIELNFED